MWGMFFHHDIKCTQKFCKTYTYPRYNDICIYGWVDKTDTWNTHMFVRLLYFTLECLSLFVVHEIIMCYDFIMMSNFCISNGYVDCRKQLFSLYRFGKLNKTKFIVKKFYYSFTHFWHMSKIENYSRN